MFEYKWKMPAVANTCLLLMPKGYNEYNVLLGKRSDNSDAFPGWWSLIGGFLDVGQEKVVTSVVREVQEETGLVSDEDDWHVFHIDDLMGEDPRHEHVVNICYYAIFDERILGMLNPADDIQDLRWADLNDVKSGVEELAFTHNKVARFLTL